MNSEEVSFKTISIRNSRNMKTIIGNKHSVRPVCWTGSCHSDPTRVLLFHSTNQSPAADSSNHPHGDVQGIDSTPQTTDWINIMTWRWTKWRMMNLQTELKLCDDTLISVHTHKPHCTLCVCSFTSTGRWLTLQECQEQSDLRFHSSQQPLDEPSPLLTAYVWNQTLTSDTLN